MNLGFLNKSPVLSSLFSGYAVTDLFIIPLVIAVWYMLYKTVWGLRLRSVGLNPMASMTAGIDVRKRNRCRPSFCQGHVQVVAAHLSLGYSCFFIEGMSGGKGFMGMAAMQFGNANPLAAGVGCVFFWHVPVRCLPYCALGNSQPVCFHVPLCGYDAGSRYHCDYSTDETPQGRVCAGWKKA